IRTGKLSKDDWPRLAQACGQLESAPLYVDDTPALSLLELRARVQTLKRREPNLGLIVVDYLQLMTTGRSEESRLQEVSSISRGLKEIAKDRDLPGLWAGVRDRAGRPPRPDLPGRALLRAVPGHRSGRRRAATGGRAMGPRPSPFRVRRLHVRELRARGGHAQRARRLSPVDEG